MEAAQANRHVSSSPAPANTREALLTHFQVMAKNARTSMEKKVQLHIQDDRLGNIRWRLELGENHGGATQPFSRVTFYEGGARLIASLASSQPELAADIEKLLHTINTV